MKSTTLAALLMCGAACSVDGDTDKEGDSPVLPDKPGHPVDQDQVVPDNGPINANGAADCKVPDDAQGVCLLACDPQFLLDQYVPEGTCITFDCSLADGTMVPVGGCNF